MKNKIIVSSILTIALCLSMIAGSTFALFTSESQVNVAVTSGTVKITATATALEMGSTLGDPLGEAELVGNQLTLSNFVPGDYVTFSLVVHNDSNVAINYKTIIKKAADTGLFAGLVVTIGDEAYSGSLVTSDWTPMQPDDPDVTVNVKVALPENAGNIYQDKSCSISYMVQAVQGNAPLDTPVNDVENLQEVITSGVGEVTLTENVTTTDTIVVTNGVTTIDLGGKELTTDDSTAILNENGTLTVKNGTINGKVENQADAEISDTDISSTGNNLYGGTSSGANANTVYENVDIYTQGGGLNVLYGATATFKSGSIDIQNVKSRHLFYVGSDTEATSVLIIEGGYFNLKNKKVNSSYIIADTNAVVYITGGEFESAAKKPPIQEVNGGQVIITGGTFKWDPTEWVADGYVAVEDNGVWTVTAK